METILDMFTDGACSGNQNDENIGGWGAILEFGTASKEIKGGEVNTSNNKMELDAVINAFKCLTRKGIRIRVFTDSSYVANCFKNKWYVNWRKNGWKNKKKEPVENRERWEELLSMVEENEVTFYRVKGHVSLESPNTDLDKLYRKFLEMNGSGFSFEDFKKVTLMNNRADELANLAMDELREK